MTETITRIQLAWRLAASPEHWRAYLPVAAFAVAALLFAALSLHTHASEQTTDTIPTTLAPEPVSAPAEPGRLVIIIDDIGHELRRGQRAVELPGPVTLSILP